MPVIGKLSAGKVEAEYKRKIKTPKMLHDGGGLYLQVGRNGSVSWVFRYEIDRNAAGKRRFRDMGLGALHKAGIDKPGQNMFDVSLKKAREQAMLLRAMVADGKDPIEERKREREKMGKSGETFRERWKYMMTVASYPGWNEMFDIHAMPVIGDRLIENDPSATKAVVGILSDLLDAGKFETARKLQQRINVVYQSALGTIDTPTHKSKLCLTLGRRFKKVRRNRPYASLDLENVPAFVADLRKRREMAALALEFVILTACRTGDVVGSRKGRASKPPLLWSDVDLKRRVWTVPAIKTADDRDPQPFEIPLSDAAINVLVRVKAMNTDSSIVFASAHKDDGPLGHNAMRHQIAARGKVTVHGMRTAFRTFAGERLKVERDVIETALAHKVFSLDKAEAPYKSKTKFFEKRRVMMQRWGEYATSKSNVVKLKRAA